MTGAGGAFTIRRLSWATRLSSRRLARGRAGAAIAACALAETPHLSGRGPCARLVVTYLVRRVASVSSSLTSTR